MPRGNCHGAHIGKLQQDGKTLQSEAETKPKTKLLLLDPYTNMDSPSRKKSYCRTKPSLYGVPG